MPTTLTLPKLSPTMEEGTIVKWHKKEGEFVEAGDLILEIATDKATVEYSALDAGFLRKIIVPNKASAIVNQPIAIFTESKQESIEGYKPQGSNPTPKQPETASNEDIAQENKIEEGKTTATEAKTSYAKATFQPEPPLINYTFKFPTEISESRIKSTPLARKIAKEKGLDLNSIKGTGPGGRIVEADLKEARNLNDFSSARNRLPEAIPGSFTEEPLSPMRKAIAERLQEAKSFIPHFYVQQTIDADPLTALRDELRQMDVKLTFNDFIIRACSLALKKHPAINSGFNSANNTVISFKTIDISVAVTLPSGLITPIIRHADFKNLEEISAEMRALAEKAKSGKLQPEEYKGGSFTISNLGMYGISSFAAIINPPQAAILAVSGIMNVPVVKNGAVLPGKIMNLNLSADHRVVDGVAAAEFLKTLQRYLEHPACLLI